MLPPLAKMRTVVERMRNLSDVIAVRANSSGCLQLSASTEVVKADITWNSCTHPRISKAPSRPMALVVHASRILFDPVAADGASQINDEDEAEGRERPDPKQLFSVLVHTRSFLKFLNAHAVSKTTIACTNGTFFHPFRDDNFSLVGICQGHCLISFVYIGDSADVGGVLTFYIPSVLDN